MDRVRMRWTRWELQRIGRRLERRIGRMLLALGRSKALAVYCPLLPVAVDPLLTKCD